MIGQDLDGDADGTRILLHSMARNYRKGNNESTCVVMNKTRTDLLTEPRKIEERRREYFEELLNGEDMEEEEQNVEIREEEQEEDLSEISAQEVKKEALKKMRNVKLQAMTSFPQNYSKLLGKDVWSG